MDDELRMLANVPIYIHDAGSLHIPTLRDIAILGEENYNEILSLLLLNKKNIPHLRDKPVSNFDILFANCAYSPDLWSRVKIGLELLFKEEAHMSDVGENVYFYFSEDSEKRHITSENFEYIQSLLIIANNIKIESEEEYNPANAKAAELIKRLEAGKQYVSRKKKQIVSLSSKISGLAWKSNSINMINIWDLNIYQFYDALFKVEQIDNYLFTLQGIYSGNVDGKKIKLNDLHWGNKIT